MNRPELHDGNCPRIMDRDKECHCTLQKDVMEILRALAAHEGCPNVAESWMVKQAARALRALGGTP